MGHALAETVECHGDAFLVQLAGGGKGIVERFAGHKTGGEPAGRR